MSVIVPAHAAGPLLTSTLSALLSTDATNWECIVVDDGDGASADLAAAFGFQGVRVARPSGPAAARNRGAAVARGEVLFFIDSDVRVYPQTIGRVQDAMAHQPDVAAIFGSYDADPPHRGFSSQFKNLSHHFVHQRGAREASTFWAGCGAVRRDVFLDVGGFDEAYRRPCIEDIELGYRLRAHGHRIVLEPGIQVTHLKQWTLAGVLRSDLLDRGIPWVRLSLRAPAGFVGDLNLAWAQRLCVALAWAAVAVAMAALATWHLWLGVLAMTAAFAVLALNASFFVWLAKVRGWRFAVAAVPLHFVYHLSNGAAVVLGLVGHMFLKPQTPRLLAAGSARRD